MENIGIFISLIAASSGIFFGFTKIIRENEKEKMSNAVWRSGQDEKVSTIDNNIKELKIDLKDFIKQLNSQENIIVEHENRIKALEKDIVKVNERITRSKAAMKG